MNTIKLIILAALMMMTANAAQAQQNENNTIKVSGFKAYQQNSRLYIDWKADSVVSNYFEVQKSEDGEKFTTIALVMGADPRKAANEFGYVGKINQTEKTIYFRLKHVDATGNEQISEIIQTSK